jgi:hypothetical protein
MKALNPYHCANCKERWVTRELLCANHTYICSFCRGSQGDKFTAFNNRDSLFNINLHQAGKLLLREPKVFQEFASKFHLGSKVNARTGLKLRLGTNLNHTYLLNTYPSFSSLKTGR